MQISTILSDYDGTLIPTTLIHSTDIKHEGFANDFSQALLELEKILWKISNKINIGIISTKDFNFLHYRTRYAKIISCMMSIETILIEHIESDKCYKYNCVKQSILNIDSEIFHKNSQKLAYLINKISSELKDVSIERKLIFKSNLLAGITIDWRNLDDWNSIKKQVEPYIMEIVNNEINKKSEHPLYIQQYSYHPFIDVYSSICSKEIAYDNISKIINELAIDRVGNNKKMLYLGDSENDNPAFRKADISIGIKSDERLNPKLDCQYTINFNQLPKFLKNLLNNDFIFSEKLL